MTTYEITYRLQTGGRRPEHRGFDPEQVERVEADDQYAASSSIIHRHPDRHVAIMRVREVKP